MAPQLLSTPVDPWLFRTGGNTQIETDGRTVWVNGHDGMCLGRFSQVGIDIHRSFADQAAGLGECLECTHEPATAADWDRFQAGMMAHHGIQVASEFRPNWL